MEQQRVTLTSNRYEDESNRDMLNVESTGGTGDLMVFSLVVWFFFLRQEVFGSISGS